MKHHIAALIGLASLLPACRLFEPLDGYTAGPIDASTIFDGKVDDAPTPLDASDASHDAGVDVAPDVSDASYEADSSPPDVSIPDTGDEPDVMDAAIEPDAPPPLTTQLAVGFYHNCALKGKTLYCWGYNVNGMLGIGTTETQYTPVKVDSSEWSSVSAGYHTCGIKTNGRLYCWGYNVSGELGDGTVNTALTPNPVGNDTWLTVSAGWRHTCGIQTNKRLYCWGSNILGQVGDGTQCPTAPYTCSGATDEPRLVGSDAWESVSVGKDFTCGIKAGGTLHCWGDNTYGQVGVGVSDTAPKLSPVQVGSATWLSVSAYWLHACAVRSDHRILCWGDNRAGQLGNGSLDMRDTPAQIGSDIWLSVSAGKVFTCGVKADRSAWCWGHNQWGQLGDGTNCPDPAPYTCANKSVPTAVVNTNSWDVVYAGGGHTCGLQGTSPFCWGLNDKGQLGDTTTQDKLTPQLVPLP